MNKLFKNAIKILTPSLICILTIVAFILVQVFFLHNKYITIGNLAEIFSAICAVAALYFAIRAYNDSIKARNQSSFDTVFSQLLAGFTTILNNEITYDAQSIIFNQHITVSNACRTILSPQEDVSHNFARFYKNCLDSRGGELTVIQISNLWNQFCKSITIRDNFEMRFRYLYNMIRTVTESPLDDAQKESYISIIQSQLSAENLLCYFCNIISFSKGNPDDPTVILIKRYGLFKDFCNTDIFNEYIKDRIDSSILRALC